MQKYLIGRQEALGDGRGRVGNAVSIARWFAARATGRDVPSTTGWQRRTQRLPTVPGLWLCLEGVTHELLFRNEWVEPMRRATDGGARSAESDDWPRDRNSFAQCSSQWTRPRPSNAKHTKRTKRTDQIALTGKYERGLLFSYQCYDNQLNIIVFNNNVYFNHYNGILFQSNK